MTHINYTHPEFGDRFFTQFATVQSLFNSHSVLSEKQAILNRLDAQNVIQLHRDIARLHTIFENEPHVWDNITLKPNFIVHNADVRALHEEEKAFVKEHSQSVKQQFGAHFTRLEEYAIVSQTQEYAHAYQDYQKFQQAVDALRQLESMHAHTKTQKHLAQKITTKLQGNASIIAGDVQMLKDSHEGQLAILARLPGFTF